MQTIAASARQIFLDAIELPAADQRAVFVSEACAEDELLLHEVERLLEAHAQNTLFMARPAVPTGLPLLAAAGSASESIALGTLIDRYKLVEKIGEGGMGVVYIAEQTEPVRRQVALKIIKPGLDTRHVIARFEAERQTLALMEHPNIARILDAGTVGKKDEGGRMKDEGTGTSFIPHPSSFSADRPYFVMELVRGLPITEYCEQAGLSVNQRLELFITVCQAVQHAHQKGIIHRDLKPSNVLVTLVDAKPVPKVIDFGVAKALTPSVGNATQPIANVLTPPVGNALRGVPESREGEAPTEPPTRSASEVPTQARSASEDSLATSTSHQHSPPNPEPRTHFPPFHTGHAALGTLLYMSPEQATPGNQDIDTRSDVYSLGVILYELLTGMTPIESARIAGPDNSASQPRICDESSDTVSIRIAKTKPAQGKGSTATFRRGQPESTELDAIVERALERNRNQRYESPSALARDVERYLKNEPVQAFSQTAAYRLRKYVIRHRRVVASLAALLLVIAAGGGLATWQALEARQAKTAVTAANAKLLVATREQALQQQIIAAETARAELQTFYGELGQVADRSLRRPPGWAWHNVEQIERLAPLAPDEQSRYQIRSELARTLAGHDVRPLKTLWEGCDLFSLAWSPDGSYIAAGNNACSGGEPFVRLYRGSSWQLERELTIQDTDQVAVTSGEPEGVRSLAFSSDAKRLTVGTRHGRVLVYDVPSGTVLHHWKAHADHVRALLHLPDGMLVTGSRDGSICYWRVGDEQPFHSESTGPDITALASARGWLFVNADKLWRFRLPTHRDKKDLRPHEEFEARPTRMALAPDGRSLFLASTREVALYDIFRGKVARTFSHPGRSAIHDSLAVHATVAPHGRWALTSDSAALYVWDFASGTPIGKVNLGGRTRVVGEFHPALPLLAVAGDGRLQVFEIFSDPIFQTVLPQSTPIQGMDLTRDGRVLASVAPMNDRSSPTVQSGNVMFLDAPWTGVPIEVRASRHFGQELALSPAGDVAAIASASWNYLLVVQRNQPGKNSAGTSGQFNAFKPEYTQFSADGRRIWLTADSPTELIPGQSRTPDTLISVSVPELQPTYHWVNAASARRLRVSEFKGVAVGRQRVVAGNMDQTVRSFDADTGQLQAEISIHPHHPRSIALTPDESQAIVGVLDGGLLILDLNAGRVSSPIAAHRELVTAVATSDSGLVVSGGGEGTVRFWRAAGDSLAPLFALEASTWAVRKIALTGDGRLMATLYDGEGGVRLLHTDLLLQRFREVGL